MAEEKLEKATLKNPTPEYVAPEDAVALDYADREPDKPIPSPGDDGYDTPSGRAIAIVGAPGKNDDPTSDKERKRAKDYRRIKELMRRGPGVPE